MHAKLGDRDLGKPVRARDHATEDEEINRLRRELRQHPCHGCDEREDHARWAERYHKLLRETEGLRRRVEGRSHVIARTFDRVCGVLDQLGYLQGATVTEEGRRLAKLYTELDLLTAECLRAGLWDDLDAAELAACVSSLVYEARQSDDARSPKIPAGAAKEALASMVRLWSELEGIEEDHGLSFIREPDFGFAWAAFRWARGHSLDAVLTDGDLAAGDFVRWVKQLLDLLGQLRDAAPRGSRVRETTVHAIDAMRRGVVAYSSVN
jgi:ATP-dependent RNA helicase HelY